MSHLLLLTIPLLHVEEPEAPGGIHEFPNCPRRQFGIEEQLVAPYLESLDGKAQGGTVPKTHEDESPIGKAIVSLDRVNGKAPSAQRMKGILNRYLVWTARP
jgi:hypothetical protein